ncbi:histidinol phosphate aminotransferase [Salipiger sp. 1_MG-2023]|uniref:histidinol phosphate aminotransferase n=1 Tax=Salipiger sp. 1_MG-2023 TaxID=3062665 RepID=UPI0026E11A61|nr:histidinol phosphate aminotransferase [Salipiger sp. 1_MG-2023]MDO6586233.1 histidinol phosphate aminotransferase [Salipiger sp. 1_MG-2023]
MDERTRQTTPEYTTSALFFIFINMLWIFGVFWVNWGLEAVAIAGVIVNHLITLLDNRINGEKG